MGSYPDLFPKGLRAARSRRRRIRQWGAVLVLEVLMLAAASIILRADRVDSVGEVRATIKSTVAQIDVVNGAIGQSRARLQEVERQMAVVNEVSRHPDWSIVLALLGREAEGTIVVENCQLFPASQTTAGGPAEFRFTLQGTCNAQRDLTKFVQSLQSSGVFSRVVVAETTRIPGERGSETLHFSIDSAFAEGGGR
ncbi:MAG: hypothetical protein IPJ41_16205 [Phycisphaerales bacterium]|nr:hypothetical protein [Phycisphaerales bacterium]